MTTERFTAERLQGEPVRTARPRARTEVQTGPLERTAAPASLACAACQGAAGPCPAYAAAAGAVGGMPPGRALDVAPLFGIGPVGDPYERQAERVADRVMRMGIPAPQPVRRKTGARRPGVTGLPVPGLVHEVLGSGGRPLDWATRAFMEPRLGQNLGQVRLHTDGRAAESARASDAAAYTAGRDIVFGAGRYALETGRGRRLLAHEPIRAVQQGDGGGAAIQRASLTDYQDKDPLHDPSRLTDAQIRATDEYQSFSTYSFPPLVGAYATLAEGLLAARLLLRHLREGRALTPWSTEGLARELIDGATTQLGVLGSTPGSGGEAELGTLQHQCRGERPGRPTDRVWPLGAGWGTRAECRQRPHRLLGDGPLRRLSRGLPVLCPDPGQIGHQLGTGTVTAESPLEQDSYRRFLGSESDIQRGRGFQKGGTGSMTDPAVSASYLTEGDIALSRKAKPTNAPGEIVRPDQFMVDQGQLRLMQDGGLALQALDVTAASNESRRFDRILREGTQAELRAVERQIADDVDELFAKYAGDLHVRREGPLLGRSVRVRELILVYELEHVPAAYREAVHSIASRLGSARASRGGFTFWITFQ